MIALEIPLITEQKGWKSSKFDLKPLPKLKICDVLQFKYNNEMDSFTLRNRTVSLVSCGSSISDTIQDDDLIFSFLVCAQQLNTTKGEVVINL